jgi:glycerol-3-phosphate dehydrogenase
LALALARTVVDHGGVIANYVRAERFVYANGRISGVVATDREGGREFTLSARCIINATGIFVDKLRLVDQPEAPRLLALSRGTHIVVPAEALGGSAAILVPKTSDGRVLFAIPWHRHVVIGTTDLPVTDASLDPVPEDSEIDYIIETVNRYLSQPIGREDITATFAGLRPLVHGAAASTAKLSREHAIDVSKHGLVSIAGGKWTTYRKMGQDVVDAAAVQGDLPKRPCVTANLPLHGATTRFEPDDVLRTYGSDAIAVAALAATEPELARKLHPRLPYTGAQVVYAARKEMARTVDDVLARRTRALFLDAAASEEAAPQVARLLARELSQPPEWEAEQLSSFAPIGAIGRIAARA